MLNFLIAPDFPPEDFAGWHLFNTQLQRLMDTDIHLVMPAEHHEQDEWIKKDDIALIYANPFDASALVRERGYLPLARPNGRPDEMVIASYADAPYTHSDELKKGCKILVTDNQDVQLLGLRLLESAGIGREDIEWIHVDTYQEAARRLIEKEADAAFFLLHAYQNFRPNTLKNMKTLMESHINDLTHVVLLNPKYKDMHPMLLTAFVHMVNEPAGKMVLEDLNIPQGFTELDEEDAEFMIDLIETLRD
ncbi:PhnD/SsuA/transferrin family substrate-binding protein [Neisseriaceae bacterium B1]